MLMPIYRTTQSVLFPGALMPVIFFEEEDKAFLDAACSGEDLSFGFFFDLEPETPLKSGVIGTAAQIVQHRRERNGDITVIIKGLTRVCVSRIVSEDPFPVAETEPLHDPPMFAGKEMAGHIREVFGEYLDTCTGDVEGMRAAMEQISTVGRMADTAMTCLPIAPEERQRLLETLDPVRRAEEMIILYRKHLDSLRQSSPGGVGPGYSPN